MAGNEVKLTFAGDAQQLLQASKKTQQATNEVTASIGRTEAVMKSTAGESNVFGSQMNRLSGRLDAAAESSNTISDGLQSLSDIQNSARNKAQQHARALVAVEQAMLDGKAAASDYTQAFLDVGDAHIDAERAALDLEAAQSEYNTAVKEYGANSFEARDAALAVKEAQQDAARADADLTEATNDMSQATIDGKNAQLDLNDAQAAANPPKLSTAASDISMYANAATSLAGTLALLSMAYNAVAVASMRSAASAVISRAAILAGAIATGVATAAQWLWNIAMIANPIGLVILAITALVAAIVWIATQTTWFQDIWNAAWGWIKETAGSVWSWIKDKAIDFWNFMQALPAKLRNTFTSVANFISAPFRAAFNLVSDAWNRTVGSLRWTVPGWVPSIGGNSISAPRLPKFHSGGIVPGSPGDEVLAILQAGETVVPAGRTSARSTVYIEYGGDPAAIEFLRRLVRIEAGGDVQLAFGGG